MDKKKIESKKREPTRRQLTSWQRESKRHQVILAAGIFIIVGVLILVGVGWFMNEYRPMHETVITVNNTSFDMAYFIKHLKAYGQGQSASYLYSIAAQLPSLIERDELVKQEAIKLGYTISDDAVKQELQKRGLSDDFWDIIRTDLLISKLKDEYFGPTIPQTADQRQIMAMLLESRSQADEIAARLDKGEDFATLAKESSLDSTTKDGGGDLGWHQQGILTDSLGTSVVDDYAFNSQIGVLSRPMYDDSIYKAQGYWLIKITERKEDNSQVHAYALLLGSAEEAQGIKTRLENGEDLAAIAMESSQYTTSSEGGGDLGWVSSGSMGTAFDDFAFNQSLDLNKWSDPIKDTEVGTKGGYWLIKVVNTESNRQVSDADMAQLKIKAVNEWITGLIEDTNNKIDDSALTEEKMVFAIQKASGV